MIPITFILVVCALIFNYHVQKNLYGSFLDGQKRHQDVNEAIIKNLVSNNNKQAIKAKRTISFLLKDVPKNINANKSDSLVNYQIADILGNLGIDNLWLYNEGQVVFSLNDESFSDLKVFDQYVHNDEVNNAIVCESKCLYLSKIRLDHVKAIFSINLEDLINQFTYSSRSSIAIVSLGISVNDSSPSNPLWIPVLRAQLETASNFYTTLSVLKNIPAINYDEYNGDFFLVDYDRKQWIVNLIPSEFSKIFFVVLDDVSHEKNILLKAKEEAFLVLVICFGFLITLLYFLINKPLLRLKKVGESMPMLATSNFQELRDFIGEPKKQHNTNDEVYKIHQTAYRVSQHLEKIEYQLNDNTIKLSEALDKVSNQHEFLKNLLNHSQVLVFALNSEYKITLANHFVSEYVQCSTDSLKNCDLSVLFDTKTTQILKTMIGQLEGEPIQHESGIYDANKQWCWISWIHCKLPQKNSHDLSKYLSLGVDITYRKKAEEKIQYLADYDALTGIYNRRLFSEKADKALLNSEAGDVAALLYFDLNKFKQINDIFGHQTGDKYLLLVSQVLSSYCLSNSIVGRLGGDEFAMLFSNCDEQHIINKALLISQKISQIRLSNKQEFINYGTSIGIAFFPQHGLSIEALMYSADLAMYTAKHSPKDQVYVYSDASIKMPKSKFDKRNFIKKLMHDDSIYLEIQPIFDITKQHIAAFECLARVKDTNTIIVNATELFQFSIESDMLMSIDLYIVNKMIKLLTKLDQLVLKRVLWGYSLDATTRLSVNLSAKSLVNKKFQKVLLAILEKNRVDLNKVVFEITETSMITDFVSIERYMAILKKRGAVFALDDFGSGFSGWQSFRNLDFEWIKIDGEFIVNIDSNPQDQVIVNSLINVVHKLNKHIVVEWVETPAVYEYLAKRNIEMMQGFYLARPQCIDKLLSASTWQEKNKQVNNNNRLKHVISTKAEITSNT